MNTLHFFRRITAGALLAAALFAPTLLRAQSGIGDIVYTVGTTTRDTNGQDWAYILWQGTTPTLISNRVFAVYSKPGEATNPAPYLRRSILMTQTDARVIEPLLRRGAALGDDMFKLQDDLLQIFGNLMPSNAISRADQLSAVIRGSILDAKYYQNLLLLARNHPGINLALGFADAQLMAPGSTETFEVRVYDMIMDRDVAVIGRVTVTAGSPTVLPQPGPPVVLPEASARGDLNVKLRWSTPDPLRRLGLMQFGYNVYRVERSYALSHGWNAATPPPTNALYNLVATSPGIAKRVNKAPVTPRKLFNLVEAANVFAPGDTNTAFVMDDDGRGRSNYVNLGWVNGAQFFYYVAARDVLGRDGALSPGVLATVCDRMPPLPPRSVNVLNDYKYDRFTKTSNQALRVVWKQNKNTNDTTTNYWIYRWTSITQMQTRSGDISNNLIAVVPHNTNLVFNSYLDVGPTSPKAATDLGKTYWYTVRAGDAGACGQNLSGPGGPAYGVLRDRTGPDAGVGIIEINCTKPYVRYLREQFVEDRKGDADNYNFHLTCTRLDQRFEWAQFFCVIHYSTAGGGTIHVTNEIGPILFAGSPSASVWWTPPRSPDGGVYSAYVDVWCRAALKNGKVSTYAYAPQLSMPPVGAYAQVDFEAYTQTSRVRSNSPEKDRECFEHDPGGPSGGGVTGTNNIGIIVIPTPGTKEYRVYRRVDDGPMSLLCDGPVTNIFAFYECFENAPPVNGGTICFYLQLLDEHGNPSPMVNIGCIDTAPVEPLPTPVLTKITATGNTNFPGMNVSWFCPPYGVDRFEVHIAGIPKAPNTNSTFSTYLAYTGAPPLSVVWSNSSGQGTNDFYSYITPKVGPGFGNNAATFLVPANIEIGKTYVVNVRALGKTGSAGEWSNFELFLWGETNVPSPQVPWPKRPLPPTNSSFVTLAFPLSPTNGSASFRTSDFEGNAVLVGAVSIPRAILNPGRDGQPPTIATPTPYDPHSGLETNAAGEVIFPCVLYRYQVPNANFPTVSGDVIQVSPLMEKIAYQLDTSPGKQPTTTIWDPFIAVTGVTLQTSASLLLWIRDTQPVISGARYRYVLVRLKENKEIDQLIVSNEVEVP